MVTYESVLEIQIWIISLHNWNMDFIKIMHDKKHLYLLTDFQNSRIVEIRGTNDDSWYNWWNHTSLTKIFDWIVESQNALSRDKSDYIYNHR